jgi:hypothetical protein
VNWSSSSTRSSSSGTAGLSLNPSFRTWNITCKQIGRRS